MQLLLLFMVMSMEWTFTAKANGFETVNVDVAVVSL
jgi:hypothetical protein